MQTERRYSTDAAMSPEGSSHQEWDSEISLGAPPHLRPRYAQGGHAQHRKQRDTSTSRFLGHAVAGKLLRYRNSDGFNITLITCMCGAAAAVRYGIQLQSQGRRVLSNGPGTDEKLLSKQLRSSQGEAYSSIHLPERRRGRRRRAVLNPKGPSATDGRREMGAGDRGRP